MGVYEIYIEIKDSKHVLDKESSMTNCISITFHTAFGRSNNNIRGAFGKFRAWYFILVTDL